MSETTESHAYAELAKPKWNNRTYIDIGSPEIKGKYWSGDYLYQKQQKYYTYLNQYNNGQRNGPCRWNDQREILVENLHLIDAISSVLPLTISERVIESIS